jgi:hypothetical protein
MTTPAAAAPQRPTYVGIGAQKCASTWLYRVLASHPQVAVPEAKELDFFSYRYDRGYQWYESCFPPRRNGHQAAGEISPSYFSEPCVPERIVRYAPEARVVVSLREPVERALSNHRHEVRLGHLRGGDLSFERGLANNPMYVEQGLYAKHLRNWLRYFPFDQVMVVLHEDVASDPEGVSRRLYRFLGVDEHFVSPALGGQFNRSYATRSLSVARLKDSVYAATRGPALRCAWDAAAGLGLRSLYRGVNTTPSETVIPAPSAETIARLRQTFEPDIRDLEILLGRSLQTWLPR